MWLNETTYSYWNRIDIYKVDWIRKAIPIIRFGRLISESSFGHCHSFHESNRRKIYAIRHISNRPDWLNVCSRKWIHLQKENPWEHMSRCVHILSIWLHICSFTSLKCEYAYMIQCRKRQFPSSSLIYKSTRRDITQSHFPEKQSSRKGSSRTTPQRPLAY